MIIQIKIKKIVSKDGVPLRQIIKIDGVEEMKKLPIKYLQCVESIYRTTNCDGKTGIVFQIRPNIYEDDIIDEEQYFGIIAYIQKSWERFQSIQSEISKLRESWKGEETIIIGI